MHQFPNQKPETKMSTMLTYQYMLSYLHYYFCI